MKSMNRAFHKRGGGVIALLALLATALTPATSAAQFGESMYVSVTGTYVIPKDTRDFSRIFSRIDGHTLSGKGTKDHGFGALVAMGYEADTGIRGEIEIGIRKVDYDEIEDPTIAGPGFNARESATPIDGDITTLSLMANGFYAFEVGKLRPYLGMGIGAARHDETIDGQTIVIDNVWLSVEKRSGDTVKLGYQGMAGIGIPIGDRAEGRLGYRYFATGGDYTTHNAEIGVLFRF